MATRAFILPLRNDLSGMNVFIRDLLPNTSQKNGVLDGVGQTHYLKFSFDSEADNQVVDSGEGLVSGSATTDTLGVMTVADVVDPAGNDSVVVPDTEFGLKAYLRDRVHVNPGGAGDLLSQAEVNNLYDDIVAQVAAGGVLDLTWINARLVARAGANTDLDGAGAASDSFGSVEDIMRILSGEVYRVRANTILGTQAGAFSTLATREGKVAASILADPVYAQGGFLTADDTGFRSIPVLVLTEAIRLSSLSGVLAGLSSASGVRVLNPHFAYTGTTPTATRPAATNPWTGTTLPTTGIAPICRVVDSDGNVV